MYGQRKFMPKQVVLSVVLQQIKPMDLPCGFKHSEMDE